MTAAIPAGRVISYQQVALALGCPRSARAVGNALRSNPFAPAVPCHRVVKGGGGRVSLGGFFGSAEGSRSSKRKLSLLSAEGVAFDDRLRLVSLHALLSAAQLDAASVARARSIRLAEDGLARGK